MRFETEAPQVEAFYALADALKAADKALDKTATGKRAALDALLDKPVYPGDLGMLAKQITALADEWQGELDAEVVS